MKTDKVQVLGREIISCPLYLDQKEDQMRHGIENKRIEQKAVPTWSRWQVWTMERIIRGQFN